ncbi:MAG: 2-hydroxychromene-2-carboxylate isomerase [Burkholderiales bacterium]|nr:2-hydroxychromene-2-carboxylate isomerase [Zoogloeaceae bacterium]MBV6410282.1 2-hydroxychromene-2-carboxylate isomerase [Rhodocyclaceae bacterium]MCZ2421302.1 2-hydroxychromene-2-carboxylate isomerase [Burkholderiales bacterium]
MAEPIEFYFDFSSPYSYIASEVIDGLAERYGRKVKWRPMLLGVVFQKTGQPLLVNVPLKGEYSLRDFARSARYHGVPFKFPAKFPLSTVSAARAYYWLHGQDCAKARQFARAAFRAYWVDGRDISDLAVLQEIAAGLGVDPAALAAGVATPEIKERLRAETEAALAKGMCGAPWFVVDGEPFWGADRLPQIEKWLQTGGF